MQSQLQEVIFKSVKYRNWNVEIATITSSNIKKLLGEPQDIHLHFWLWRFKDTTYCFNTQTSEVCFREPVNVS